MVPRSSTCNADDFIRTAQLLKDDYGHQEVNLNLGCPSGTVTAKGKGCRISGHSPRSWISSWIRFFRKLDMKISIKTRIGTHYEEDWEYLLAIYEKYPIHELDHSTQGFRQICIEECRGSELMRRL